jgi:hypothetical protein
MLRMTRNAGSKAVELIPSLASVSEEYRALKDTHLKLGARLSAITPEMRSISDGAPDNNWPPSVGSHEHDRIAILLGDKNPAAPLAPRAPGASEKIRTLQQEAADIRAAMEILEPRIAKAARAASVIVCEQVRIEYGRCAKAVVAATLALHAANVEYTGMTDAFEDAGISWSSLSPLYPCFAGGPQNKLGPIAQFLYEAVEGGWLTNADLPPEFRL